MRGNDADLGYQVKDWRTSGFIRQLIFIVLSIKELDFVWSLSLTTISYVCPKLITEVTLFFISSLSPAIFRRLGWCLRSTTSIARSTMYHSYLR